MIKNAKIYTLTKPVKITNEQLQEQAFVPVTSGQFDSMGFVAPRGFADDQLIVCEQGYSLLNVKLQTKILPAPAIQKELQARVDKIEQRENREVYRKERIELKDDVLADMLPRAFTKDARTAVIIDWDNHLVIIDTTSNSHAESILNMLREALGSLAVIPLITNLSPHHVMTERLIDMDRHFISYYGSKLKIASADGETTHSYKHQEFNCPEIVGWLQAGMYVKELEILTKHVNATITDNLTLKGIEFTDALREQADAMEPDTAELETKAALIVTASALSAFILALIAELGGRPVEGV